MKKKDPIRKHNNEISDGVSMLLVVYRLKEKPNNRKRTLLIV